MMSEKEVLNQSKSAYNQWAEVWRSHAIENGKKYRADGNSQRDLLHQGVGKTLLCVATSPSIEKQVDVIKKYRDEVDILCVDKSYKFLMDNGIKPDYVILCDAKVNYEEWCKPYIDDTEDVILFMNVTGNTDWSMNWKGKVIYFVNKDNIQSEVEFSQLSGCQELIPAGSNVGNSVVLFSTQVLGYDRYLLAGYDYCWSDDTNYYSGGDTVKRYWMKHLNQFDRNGRVVYTSQNLFFSVRWLGDYNKNLAMRGIKVYDCSLHGMLNMPWRDLETMLKLYKRRKLTLQEKQQIAQSRLKSIVTRDENQLKEALGTTEPVEVIVNYLPEDVKQWLDTA